MGRVGKPGNGGGVTHQGSHDLPPFFSNTNPRIFLWGGGGGGYLSEKGALVRVGVEAARLRPLQFVVEAADLLVQRDPRHLRLVGPHFRVVESDSSKIERKKKRGVGG